MEPWDGPAALCGAYNDWAIAGMDRNGLRPIRYTLTKNYSSLVLKQVWSGLMNKMLLKREE